MDNIAIIGMSCRFPGACNPEEFWEILSKGLITFQSIPEERKLQHNYDRLNCNRGSFISNPFHFDNRYFNISDEEAVLMDPQQRIMLELAIESLTDAGYDNFKNRNVGVFIGANQRAYGEMISSSYYREKVVQHIRDLKSIRDLPSHLKESIISDLDELRVANLGVSTLTGSITNMIAGRISHEFNLKGPSLTIDTACSSSLVAVHLACESLNRNECSFAYAGGVNLNLTPSIYYFMEAAQVLSKTGNCIPFSKESDGILLGEGAGLVILKKLESALADNDPVLAIIKGTGMNNDGRSLGIMAPSREGQLKLFGSTYTGCEFDPNNISVIEAHGTSTTIGDSIELSSIEKFFSRRDKILSVGSVKSNIGHLLGAAGIAGLIKMILALNKRQLPPSLHGKGPNPKWKLSEKGIKIQDKLEDWNSVTPRAAGINSYGFGGTNAHVIIEEPDQKLKSKNKAKAKIEFNRKYHYYNFFPALKQSGNLSFLMNWIAYNDHTSFPVYQPDHWILICSNEPEHKSIGEILIKAGKGYTGIHFSNIFSRSDEFSYTLNEENPNHYKWLLSAFEGYPKIGILYVCPEETESSSKSIINKLCSIRNLFLYADKFRGECKIWSFTYNAFQVNEADTLSPPHRSYATLLAGTMEENPKLRGGCIDIDGPEFFNGNWVTENSGKIFSRQLVIRANETFEPNLIPLMNASNAAGNITITKNGIYLVVGGSSGVGAEIAAYIANKNVSKVIISGTRSREDLPDKITSFPDNKIEYLQASAFLAEDTISLIDGIIEKYGRIDGIVFAAGKIAYGSVINMDEDDFNRIIRTKIEGVNNLYQAVKDKKIDFVCLISSISGLTPSWSKGMVEYGAANAYLDAFAVKYSSQETKWISLSWCMWENTGMSKAFMSTDSLSLVSLNVSTALTQFDRSLSGEVFDFRTFRCIGHFLQNRRFSQKG